MGSNVAPQPGHYVRQLVDHASALRREARRALQDGDYARAEALIAEAELLAADVHGLVEAMEERQTGEFVLLAAEQHAALAAGPGLRRRGMFSPRSRKLGAAFGASLAMSLALAEC